MEKFVMPPGISTDSGADSGERPADAGSVPENRFQILVKILQKIVYKPEIPD